MKLSNKLIAGLFAGLLLIWIAGYAVIDTSRKALEDQFVHSISSLSSRILYDLERDLYEQIEIFREYSHDSILQESLRKSNLEFGKLRDAEAYIDMREREWTTPAKGDITPFMQGLLDNDLSAKLREKAEYHRNKRRYTLFSEISVTNRYGVNAAQTSKSTDYRQDDEEWWRTAKYEGLYIGDIEYDESAEDYGTEIALRIQDEDRNFIGVTKVLLSIDQIINTLNDLKDHIQNEQHMRNVTLRLAEKGEKLIYSSVKGDILLKDASRFFQPGVLKKMRRGSSLSVEHDGTLSVYIHSKEYKGIKSPDWVLIMDFDTKEIFAPVNALRNRLVAIYLGVTLAMLVMGVFASSRITESVLQLRDAAIRIGKGDLDTVIAVNTRDEVGELAEAFNQMRDALKSTNAVRDRLTEDLQESEERLKSVLETANDAIVSFDINGTIIFWNTAAEKIFGHSANEIVGMPVTSCMSEQFNDFYKNRLATDAVWENPDAIEATYEFYGFKKDGREFPAEFSLAVWRKKKETFFTAIIRDITERRRTEKLIQLQFNRLNVLHSIEKAVNSSIDLHSTLDILTDQITTRLEIDAVSVLLMNSHTRVLEHVISKGFRSNALRYTQLRLGESNAGRAALEQRIVGIPDLVHEPDGFVRSALFPEERFISYLAVPLVAKGEVKGVMELFHRRALNTDQEWLDFLETIADQAAIAIDHASLFRDLQGSRNELMLAYDRTIVGWSNALDMKDKETEGHSLRVTDITARVAAEMGIKGEDMVHIRRGALLHDIGKMGIPDSILLKPGKLTEEEWEIMKRHPRYAFDMLGEIEYLRPALDIPLYHHEKWDGTGYPRGLKGKEIPLGARIFAVVDVWDALTTDRPYRPAWSKEKTLDYIRSLSGVQFDPDVVKLFLRMSGDLSLTAGGAAAGPAG